ncbi:N-acetylmuramic acid 6-phosphate etherase [Paenibacillus beijingensis]|uniref:N-acetylmuramic acid 6-phosphate etherase n=1 Tax=Paenibacillus beijingensis TaxID=1126833 RepID=A0A0D5NJM8_9BACL|nr:N-acetylmuramic acid 6-phosphate etherase [Paenibacillus beijingensis]AJY75476.1 N-acetylmuramic acid-6-phosphate etherase [Paenibacillus beijingensis]
MNLSTDHLTSEQQNERTRHIDKMSAEQILRLINAEDRLVPGAVEACIPDIALAVEAVVRSFKMGGRLLYFGAGTSGRLGILDASECPPTYGTDPDQVVGVIAGGERAIRHPVEGYEDSEELGRSEADDMNVGPIDVVVGIAASGRTPYVIGVMKRARELGATVVGISNNSPSAMDEAASIMIEAVVGPEVVLGSTRMKAGTAQKLILNMLTTASMILSGKVYDNLMVDMQSSNQKLVDRGKRLISLATGADEDTIETAYRESDAHVKTAIVMILLGVGAEEARSLLRQADGFVRKAIELYRSPA